MSEMIERVAKAIVRRRMLNGVPLDGEALDAFNEAIETIWNGPGPVDERQRAAYRSDAAAAIEAMRQPTFDPGQVSYHEGMTRRDWWSAMIDAALEPRP